MQVIHSNILDAPENFAIVQCISADCAMGVTPDGREIPCLALTLRKKYPRIVEVCKFGGPIVGDVIRYRAPDGRVIFNLVTKINYYDKPTYGSMMAALKMLRYIAISHDETKLAIPKLGSGLDRLNWNVVSEIVDRVFDGSGIRVVLYEFNKRGMN